MGVVDTGSLERNQDDISASKLLEKNRCWEVLVSLCCTWKTEFFSSHHTFTVERQPFLEGQIVVASPSERAKCPLVLVMQSLLLLLLFLFLF